MLMPSFFRLTTLISSLLLLVYLYLQVARKCFLFVINDNLAFSPYLSFLCKPPLFELIFILIGIILICSVIFNGKYIRYLGYFFSLMLLNLAWMISFDLLALKNVTIYFLVKVYHPIPLEVKLDYLASHLSFICEAINLPTLAEPLLHEIIVSSHLREWIMVMEAEEIQDFARKMVYTAANQYYNEPNFPLLSYFFSGSAIAGIIFHLFYFCNFIFTTYENDIPK